MAHSGVSGCSSVGTASALPPVFLSSSDPSDLNLAGLDGRKIIVDVDTTLDDYFVMSVDMSMLTGAEIIFRKVSSDENRIIDGFTNHVNRPLENVCVLWDGTGYIVV